METGATAAMALGLVVVLLGMAGVYVQQSCSPYTLRVVESSVNESEYTNSPSGEQQYTDFENLSATGQRKFERARRTGRASMDHGDWDGGRYVRYDGQVYEVVRWVNECGEKSVLTGVGLLTSLIGVGIVGLGLYRRSS